MRPDCDQPLRRPLVFTIVALALLMMSVDSTIVATALQALQQGLGTSINWAGWTLTAYSFGFVLMLPISGRLSERYGHRRVFLGSVIAFTMASLCCGLVDDIFALIALRAVQAAGGAGLTPSATGIIVDHFGDERDRAVSLFGSIFPIGAMIGPIFGGLFVSYWTWRGVFFVNVPIGIAVIVLAMRYVPKDRPPADKSRFWMDPAGMVLLAAALLAGMFAISYMGEKNARVWSLAFVVPSVIAIVAAWWFVHHINRSPHPFIAPCLIHGPGFGPVNLVNAIYGGITLGAVVLIPLYAANRYQHGCAWLRHAAGRAGGRRHRGVRHGHPGAPAHRLPNAAVHRRRNDRGRNAVARVPPRRHNPAVRLVGRFRLTGRCRRRGHQPGQSQRRPAAGPSALLDSRRAALRIAPDRIDHHSLDHDRDPRRFR